MFIHSFNLEEYLRVLYNNKIIHPWSSLPKGDVSPHSSKSLGPCLAVALVTSFLGVAKRRHYQGSLSSGLGAHSALGFLYCISAGLICAISPPHFHWFIHCHGNRICHKVLLTSSDLVSRLTELVKGNSD